MAHRSDRCRIKECSVLCLAFCAQKSLRDKVETLMQHKEGPWLLFSPLKSQMLFSGLGIFHRWLEAQKSKHCVVFLGLEKGLIIPTVTLLIEDLWGHWSPLLWLPVFGNVVVHPQSLVLHHSNVYLLKVNPIGLEKAHHVLLMFFYRDRAR